MPRKVLAKKYKGNSVFTSGSDNVFSFGGMPTSSGDYLTSGLPTFDIIGNQGSKNFSVSLDIFQGAKFDKNGAGIVKTGTGTVNIRKDTLQKGIGTLLGMAPQTKEGTRVTRNTETGEFGKTAYSYEIQGFNYANPQFTANKLTTPPKASVKDRFEALDKKNKAVVAYRDNPMAVPPALAHLFDPSYVDPDSQATGSGAIEGMSTSTALAQTNSRIKLASKNKVARAQSDFKRDGAVKYANEIQEKLGRDPITLVVTRRRRGRWDTSMSQDPMTIIDDYKLKSSTIDWAKSVDSEFGLDPERMVRVVDKQSSERIPTYWTHNGRKRRTGYRTVDTSTYKYVLATSRPEGEKMDMLFTKIDGKSKSNKTKFLSYGGEDTKLYQPQETLIKEEIKTAEAEYDKQKVFLGKVQKGATSKYNSQGVIGRVAREKLVLGVQRETDKLKILEQAVKDKKASLKFSNLTYYSISDEDFAGMDEHKSTSEANKIKYATYQDKNPNIDKEKYGDMYAIDPKADKYSYYNVDFEKMDEHKSTSEANMARYATYQDKNPNIDKEKYGDAYAVDSTMGKYNYYNISDKQFAEMDEHKSTSEANKKEYGKYFEADPTASKYNFYDITEDQFAGWDKRKKEVITDARISIGNEYTLREKLASSHRVDATTPLDDNAPKQKYLKYQKTGKDSYITPTVAELKSQINIAGTDSEKQNLQNAIGFVEGRSKKLQIDGTVIAIRDNLGRINILDSATFSKYVKNTPTEYLKQPDMLDTSLIPELEKIGDEKYSKYTDTEKAYFARELAKTQFRGTVKPKKYRSKIVRRK